MNKYLNEFSKSNLKDVEDWFEFKAAKKTSFIFGDILQNIF